MYVIPKPRKKGKPTEKQLAALVPGKYGFMESEEKRKAALKKSLETRKKNNMIRRQMKEQFQALLDCRLSKNSSVKKKLKEMGVADEDMNNQMAIIYNIFLEASKGRGASSVSAATFVRDTIGEKPKETNVNIQTDFESYVQKLESDKEF